jgi:hypothetical protein
MSDTSGANEALAKSRCRIVAAIEDKAGTRVHVPLTMIAIAVRDARPYFAPGGFAAPAAWLLRVSVWLAVAVKNAGESPSVMRRSQIGAQA